MKIILKIVIITQLLISGLTASQKMTVQELVGLASSYLKKPLIVDQNIDKQLYVYSNSLLNKNNINLILFDVLKSNGLRIVFKTEYYILEQITKELSQNRSIKIRYLSSENVENIMKFSDIKFVLVDDLILFTSLKSKFEEISSIFKKFDMPKLQKKMRITVLETNVNKMKELGVRYNFNDISKNLFNINLGNINTTISPTQTQSFGIDLKALVQDGATKIITNPILTLRDRKDTLFDITRTIPVSNGSTVIKNDDIKTFENIEYKSFGIKVKVKPIMLDNETDLELDLNLQDILSNNNDKPETSDKKLKQSVKVPDNRIYVLSGFRKTLKVTKDDGVPLLKDLPLFGYFFKWSSKEDIEIMLQILIEIVNDDDKATSNFFSPAKISN